MDVQALRTELIAMAAEDLRVREDLVRDGSLFEGYHPRMRAVHEHNAVRLRTVLETFGWPGRSAVGDEAADAAWLILQHSIGNPDLQRLGLSLLKAAAALGEVFGDILGLVHHPIPDLYAFNVGPERFHGSRKIVTKHPGGKG